MMGMGVNGLIYTSVAYAVFDGVAIAVEEECGGADGCCYEGYEHVCSEFHVSEEFFHLAFQDGIIY